ncbi:baseplate J/gp47 family protein [Methanobacterium sp.]|uniref:baseplate J/gp47 family protein n=1 Tax=Methanobacterium sp. TaxID=2164 RepID=UPI003C77A237
MADDQFTSIDNTIISVDDEVQSIIDYYKGAFDEGKSTITDFNDGSNARNLVEAIGRKTYELRFLIDDMKRVAFPQYSRNNYLDLIGARSDCERDPAKNANGILKFTLSEAKPYDTILPLGTIITSEDDSIEVQLTEGVIIEAGNTTINASAEAVEAGEDGNVVPGALTRIADPIEDLSVTNPEAFENGAEAESDESYITRIFEAEQIKVFGSTSWYKSKTENIEGVHDAKVINTPDGELFNVKIIVNGDIKPTSDELINDVIAFFEDPENDVGGLNVSIIKPTYIEQAVGGTIVIKDGYVWSNVLADVETNINVYFNGGNTTYQSEDDEPYPGLKIGDDITKSTIQTVIANTPGVLDYNLSIPAANVVTADSEEAHLASINFTQG